jgi:hypothetical protein
MPGPLVIHKPELPASINPQGASVFDAPGQGILRKMVSLLGLDDPQQIMGVGAAMDVGPMGGGLIDAVSQRFPRFAAAIKAYHGSPHDFEAFDTSKIGTGEGAQAYGHGLYFAENPSTAASYKQAGVVDPRDAISNAINSAYHITGPDNLTSQHMRDWMIREGFPTERITPEISDLALQAARGQEAGGTISPSGLKALQQIDRKLGALPRGKMYEVGINAHPDQFLDWDKPLKEQPPNVQQALAKIDPDQYHPSGSDYDPMESGQQIYHRLINTRQELGTHTNMAGQSIQAWTESRDPASASIKLREAGIPGIKYLDQGSRVQVPLLDNQPLNRFAPSNPVEARAIDALRRNTSAAEAIDYLKQDSGTEAAQQWLQANAHRIQQPQGTRNFVVFDAKTVDILKKYGLLLPAAGAGLAASQQEGKP